jgi:hypothetical protein
VKLREATADAPLESTALLVAGAAVKVDVNAAPAVPKPMSADASLAPGLRRKKVPLPDAMVREVPSNVATRAAACKAGVGRDSRRIDGLRQVVAGTGIEPHGIAGRQVDGGMAMEGRR